MNAESVAFAQRVWLSRLARLQPLNRPILAQTEKKSPWQRWDAYAPGAVLWTRSVMHNEIVFDADSKDKAFNAATCANIALTLSALGARPILADSGGRGYHVHAWLDPSGLKMDGDAARDAKALNADVWRAARSAVFDYVAKTLSEAERDTLDTTKVKWSQEKKGSMIREFGSIGSLGYAKTLKTGSLVFPSEAPSLWRVPADLRELVAEAVRREVKRTKNRSERRSAHVEPSSLGCIEKAIQSGAPEGERKKTALHIAASAKNAGESFETALQRVSAFAERVGIVGDAERLTRYAWERDYPLRCHADGGLGLSVCAGQSACPLRSLTVSI